MIYECEGADVMQYKGSLSIGKKPSRSRVALLPHSPSLSRRADFKQAVAVKTFWLESSRLEKAGSRKDGTEFRRMGIA